MDPCFIHGYKLLQNSVLLRRNIDKILIETSSRSCFCSIVSRTYLGHRFLMSKFSVNMRFTAHFEMSVMSVSSRTLSRRSSNTILRTFFAISGVVISLGPPLRCSPWQVVRSCLNSVSQYFTVVKEVADSPRVESSSNLILVGLRPFKWKNDDQFSQWLQIHWQHSLSMAVKSILNNVTSWNFKLQLCEVGIFDHKNLFQTKPS